MADEGIGCRNVVISLAFARFWPSTRKAVLFASQRLARSRSNVNMATTRAPSAIRVLAMSDSSPIDVEHMLSALEIEGIERGFTEIDFLAPSLVMSNGDMNASAYINIETAVFFCHGCKEKGDASYFVSRVLGVSRLKAAACCARHTTRATSIPMLVATEEEVRKIWKKEAADLSQFCRMCSTDFARRLVALR